ncbi:MAG TPA: hypothetical protein VKA62_00350 [Agromyces sp.]|nr:hypothetical protein [Agromyces sp.]
MNTALIAAGAEPSRRPIRISALAELLLRRARLALASGRTARQRLSRDELAVLHERRREAARLREENFRGVTFARLS